MTDFQRISVALTRGRDATIVIGDTDLFLEQEQPAWEKRLKAQPEQTGNANPMGEPESQPNVKSVLRSLFGFHKDRKAIFQYSETDIAKLAVTQ